MSAEVTSTSPAWTQNLRPYQQENARWLVEGLPDEARGRLLTDGLGVGKTFSALGAMRLRWESGLIEQPAMLCFTTASSAFDWKRSAALCWPELEVHVIGAAGKAQRVHETDEAFEQRKHPWKEALRSATKPTLIVGDYWWADVLGQLTMVDYDVLIDSLTLDECFVPGTMVQTPSGLRPIESLRVGDEVLSVDVNGYTVIARVEETRQRFAECTLDLVLGGHVVKTTPNHPFLTSRGWKRADEITEGCEVVCVVPRVPRDLKEPACEILRHKLLCEVANEPATSEGNVSTPFVQSGHAPSMERTLEGRERPAGSKQFFAHESQQPNAQESDPAESLSNAQEDGPQTENPWGQWSAFISRSCTACGKPWVAGRGDSSDQGDVQSSESHQGRYCECGDQDCGGGGRNEPQQSEGSRSGQPQNEIPRSARLARVESIQRRSLAEDTRGFSVHNLQVSGTHTYLVGENSVVVHNCHLVKKASSGRAKAIRQLVARSRQTTMLTGTPVHNRPHDLHNLLTLMAPTTTPNFWTWARRYFQIKLSDRNYEVVGGLKSPSTKAALIQDIEPLVWGRTAAQLMGKDMPARNFQLKYVEVDGAVRISPAKLKAKKTDAVDALLRSMVSHKLKAAAEIVRDADKPVVLYTYRKEDAVKLAKVLEREKLTFTLATGDLSPTARDKAIENWKQGASQALVCTMDAVRESATLTRADLMVFVDLHWLPATMLQNMGRIDPARQPENERRPVTYLFLVVRNGPDEVVAEVLTEKIREASNIGVKTSNADAFGDFLGGGAVQQVARLSEAELLADVVDRIVARENRMADLEVL